jgi:hypothetical protein
MHIKRKDGRTTSVKVLNPESYAYRVVIVDLNNLLTILDKGFISYDQAQRFYNDLTRSSYNQVVCIMILNLSLKSILHTVKSPKK